VRVAGGGGEDGMTSAGIGLSSTVVITAGVAAAAGAAQPAAAVAWLRAAAAGREDLPRSSRNNRPAVP
jgi:hypothetical protein